MFTAPKWLPAHVAAALGVGDHVFSCSLPDCLVERRRASAVASATSSPANSIVMHRGAAKLPGVEGVEEVEEIKKRAASYLNCQVRGENDASRRETDVPRLTKMQEGLPPSGLVQKESDVVDRAVEPGGGAV
ncbi:hypothetical protein BDW02DRAFT_339512 [Decorospora gaudefroyi]|uniref:Uncharacterized protein n=1 Tax=Decorospora gaudefroyi TaxID=184978 RepID=A0A6A5KDF0_9PLEO|nr:hypothetical protein BDW02DRAFT_339512 [Decorospora gaudefroyi]